MHLVGLYTYDLTLWRLTTYIYIYTYIYIHIRRTAQLTSRRRILKIYSTNILTEYFKHAAHFPPFFFSSKCLLFHNAIFFGSCNIHILNTECAKILRKFRCQRVNILRYFCSETIASVINQYQQQGNMQDNKHCFGKYMNLKPEHISALLWIILMK